MVSHDAMMDQALVLAARGRGATSPNPMVGAVVTRGDRIVGRGFHARAGGPHAEVIALEEAGETTITLVSLVAGGLAMVCFGFGLGLSEATVFGVTGTSAGALLARWWLRRAS